MVGDTIPKSVRKKIDADREKKGLPAFEESAGEGKDKKSKKEKPTWDVSFMFQL